MNYNSKIRYLYLPVGLNHLNTNLIFKLINNVKQNLNYLVINAHDVDYTYHLNSIILQNLGQILPSKIEYLNLGLAIAGCDLEVFLKNSQNIFIKKLLIRNNRKEESEDIFPYIKEYIMKKKRVKYLAILEVFQGNREDLFSLKDKLEEFKLYDIQVLDYYGLHIDIISFIEKTYLW
ncbi:hypothetical protein GLOIN_2v1869164 [Rhizophagus clarus]|nr:hypothetical protein GLOIN_2v1869164 [Rhizophagus clarus]